MWRESSSVKAVNLAKKSATIPEIQNFSYGITFLARPVSEIILATYVKRPANSDSVPR